MGHAYGTTGKCPSCLLAVRFEQTGGSDNPSSYSKIGQNFIVRTSADRIFIFGLSSCPNCGQLLVIHKKSLDSRGVESTFDRMIFPTGGQRPVPPEVANEAPNLAKDFTEAVEVLSISPKASATLSRRCLQFILVEKGGVNPKSDLFHQIDEIIPKLPSHLAENVDEIRKVGNFGAHPKKSTHSLEIIEVEPHEAEWLIDVLEDLFDFYYVTPARHAKQRLALKTKTSGKP